VPSAKFGASTLAPSALDRHPLASSWRVANDRHVESGRTWEVIPVESWRDVSVGM